MTVRGPVHLVLHDLEEELRTFGAAVVVDAGGVDVEHLLPEHPFGRPDVADAGEEFVEVIVAQSLPGFDAFVVERKALHKKLGQPGGRPLTERSADGGSNPVTNGVNGVEVVVQDAIVFVIGGSCQVFLDN